MINVLWYFIIGAAIAMFGEGCMHEAEPFQPLNFIYWAFLWPVAIVHMFYNIYRDSRR